MSDSNPFRVGDILTRTGTERLRVIALYDGCDEIVVENTDPDMPSDIYDLLWFDCELIERPS